MEKEKKVPKKKKFKERGITLIALIITIIVLLILAGVALATLTGDSGILSNADKAKEETLLANSRDQVQLAVQEALIKGNGTVTKENLVNALNKIIGEGKYTITPDDEVGPWTITVTKTGYTIAINSNEESQEIRRSIGEESKREVGSTRARGDNKRRQDSQQRQSSGN